jgi:hypothetical protein
MKIEEIVIDPKKQSLDKIVVPDLSKDIMLLYYRVAGDSGDFSMLSYEIYSPNIIADVLDELLFLQPKVEELTHISQLPEIIQILIDYFENS